MYRFPNLPIFEHCIVKKSEKRGCQVVYDFPNGYQASVIQNQGSYGGDTGLWELAILKDDCLCYDTSITNDVIGYLDESELEVLLIKIGCLGDNCE